MNAVELAGVTKRFGNQTAVNNLDLAVPEGSIYGFIGPNGSGKTTTIRMILRIFHPDDGVVSVLGKSSGAAADTRLGYLPEERGLYKRMTVMDVCRYYARLKNHYDCDPDIYDWLDRLDAREWAKKRIDALSKGMAQKVQFITSVVARPKLLILDEPFSGLDPVNLEVLRDAVLEMRNRGTTVIFSTHDMSVAERLCDTIFMIFKGNKVLDGTVESIKENYSDNQVALKLGDQAVLPAYDMVSGSREQDDHLLVNLHQGNSPQQFLQKLLEDGQQIHRFEIARPSLHDIFVSIARPHEHMEESESEQSAQGASA
ncbi:MAG: ATP-binding cassette domain-containing protein [Fuerstiella sp.]